MPVRVRNSNGASHEWRFDCAFGPAATQDDVYDAVGGPVVAKALDGYNGALLAYGQTGTGKSFTMGILDRVESEGAGVIPRALSHLFGAAQADATADYALHLQFLQVYLDCVFDLLPADGSSADLRPLPVRERASKGFHVPGASEWAVGSYEQAVDAVNAGLERRVLGATKMNATSSRSHTLLFVSVRKQSRTTAEVATGRLCLVDLAGSERVARTASTGARLDEARAINSSLAALGNVIAKLSDASKSSAATAPDIHVPFRDSKLTKLLSRSLGGQATTCVIATIGPMAIDRAETMSTLKFAERCMQVAARPVRHVARVGRRADDRLELAESQWRAQTEQLRLEYEAKLALAQAQAAVARDSASHADAAVAAKAEALARRIIGALDGPDPRIAGGSGGGGGGGRLSELLDSAASAIEPLLARSQQQGASASDVALSGSAASASALDAGMDHQALLLRYLLETNERLRAQGSHDTLSTADRGTPRHLGGAALLTPLPEQSWLSARAGTGAGAGGSEVARPLPVATEQNEWQSGEEGQNEWQSGEEGQNEGQYGEGRQDEGQRSGDSGSSPVPDRIVASRTDSSGALQYRVRWMGAPADEDEWFERAELAEDCPDLVDTFERSSGGIA